MGLGGGHLCFWSSCAWMRGVQQVEREVLDASRSSGAVGLRVLMVGGGTWLGIAMPSRAMERDRGRGDAPRLRGDKGHCL